MADERKSAGDFARDFAQRFVPKGIRDEVLVEVDKTTEVREGYESKRRVAARAGGNKTASDAMAYDDELAAQAKIVSARQLKDAEKAHADAQLRKPKRSRARRKAGAFNERGAKLHARMEKHKQKHQAKLRAAGQHDADPIGIPVFVHSLTQQVMGDPTGHMARIKLAALPPQEARKIISAALNPKPYTGRRKRQGRELRKAKKVHLHGREANWERPGRRRWSHPAAIRTAALGLALYHLRGRTSRRGFVHVVRGIPRKMFCRLAAEGLAGTSPGLSALFGNMDGVPGAMRALETAGLVKIQQPPGVKVAASDRGPSGFAFNTYWFYGSRDPSGDEDEPTDDAQGEVARMRAASLRQELGLGTQRAPPNAA